MAFPTGRSRYETKRYETKQFVAPDVFEFGSRDTNHLRVGLGGQDSRFVSSRVGLKA